MKILLTGGSGFIGRYVLKYLLEADQNVNALVRDPSKLTISCHTNLNVIKGDLNDLGCVNDSIKECDIVIHLAALVSVYEEIPSAFYETNLRGTLNLLAAAKKNNVKKFIFCSSLAAHEFLDHRIITEKSITESLEYFSKYAETKARAEQLVIEYSKFGLPYIIIYPTRVFGIGPLADCNGATKAIDLYLKNKLPFLIDKGNQYSSWAFVEDVAKGITSAATSNIFNRRYILGGENRTLADVYNVADQISGKKHLRIFLSNKAALTLASVIEAMAKSMRKKPFITREWLSFVLESFKLSSGKATIDLHYKITPIETALHKTIVWLKSL
jgi:farnesol dehydrogenase